jgi:hypothetical protein
MTGPTVFTIGTKVVCSDGVCGELDRVVVDVVDPAARIVTHLVVEPGRFHGDARLVPVDLLDSTAEGIRLRCTTSEFKALDDPGESVRPVGSTDGLYGQGAELIGGGGPSALRGPGKLTVSHVPEGAVEVHGGEHVRATDGDIGRVRGIAMDTGDHRLTHIVLDNGNRWGHKTMSIPISAVKDITDADGVRLKLTKDQVGDLPPPPAGLNISG